MASPLLDLKKFKHVKSDDNFTHLKHEQGHEIKIAHKSLSKDNQAQLAALSKLPIQDETVVNKQEASAKMAEGGELPKIGKEPYAPPLKGPSRGSEHVKLELPKKPEGFGKVIHKAGIIQKAEGGEVDHSCEGKAYCMHCGGKMAEGGPVQQSAPAVAPQMYAEGDLDIKPEQAGLPSDTKPSYSLDDIQKSLGPQGTPVSTLQSAPIPPAQYTPNIPGQQQPIQDSAQQPPEEDDAEDNTPTPVAKKVSAKQPAIKPNQPNVPADRALDDNEMPGQPKSYQDHLNEAKQEMDQEAAGLKQDFASGQIKPKTISDLMADKGLFSRIGTAFGLLLSGAGAGLTGQPNALLGLMQKQIDQDFEAQGKNITNAQNLRKMNWDHQEQLIKQKNMGFEGERTQAQTALDKMETNIKGDANGRLNINFGIAKHLSDIVNKYPAGDPRRVQAEQQLAGLNGMLDASNSNLLGVAAARVAMLKSLGGGQGGTGTGDPNEFRAEQNLLRMSPQTASLANDREGRFINGIGVAPAGEVTQAKKDQLESANLVNLKGKEIMNFIKNTNPVTLTLPNSAESKKLQQMVGEFTTYYGKGIPISQTEGGRNWIDHQLKENPGSIPAQIMHEPARFQEVIDSNAQRLDQALSGPGGLGFPKGTVNKYLSNKLMENPNSKQPQQYAGQATPKAGAVSIEQKTGKPVVFDGKKWQYKVK